LKTTTDDLICLVEFRPVAADDPDHHGIGGGWVSGTTTTAVP
jgi:hypothetical protein